MSVYRTIGPLVGSPMGRLKSIVSFSRYCNQILDKEIDTCCTTLLSDLVRFQDRQYHKDPIKAKAKRRIVLGLREVTKHLKLKKIKCVIISPNLEKIQSKGKIKPSSLMEAGFQEKQQQQKKKKKKKKKTRTTKKKKTHKKNSLNDWYIRVRAISNVGKTCGPTPCLTRAINMLKLN